MNNLENFVEILKELMQEYELNNAKLAEHLGFHKSSVSDWLNGKNAISLKHLISIANYFKCSIDFLLGRSNKFLEFEIATELPFYPIFRDCLEKNNYSRYRFVKETRFKEGNICKWSQGARPQLAVLVELADLFKCSVDYLIGRERY